MLNFQSNLPSNLLNSLLKVSDNPDLAGKSTEEALKHLQKISSSWSFLDILEDKKNLEFVQNWGNENRNRWKNIVIIGIGGSSLGPKCLVEALNTNQSTKVYFIDNVDPFEINSILQEVEFSQTLFMAISKSGSTPEILATLYLVKTRLQEQNLTLSEHLICISDGTHTHLKKLSQENNLIHFDIPAAVGGRFSVLSNVGLVLAGLLNLDIKALIAGGKSQRDLFLNSSFEENPSLQLALAQYGLYQFCLEETVVLPYSNRLKSIGDWYVQLLSESLGKGQLRDGNKKAVGITPIIARGVTDQHSQVQLFVEGPNNKFFIFLKVLNHNSKIMIPEIEDESINYLGGHSFETLLNVELDSTNQSLKEAGRLTSILAIEEINEFSLGSMFVFMELSVAILGELFYIDTFNQPGVERGKILTKEKLSTLLLKNSN